MGERYSRRSESQGAKALLCWGQERGLILEQSYISDHRPVASGAEHEVFFDAASQKAIKLTRDGSYAQKPIQQISEKCFARRISIRYRFNTKMKSLLIRDIPESILDLLKRRAKQNHRSLQGELHALLTEAVGENIKKPGDFEIKKVRTCGLQDWSREAIYEN